ncbi:MAG TPA: hypothetical protein VLB76_22710 [Thermoanaerobaculia bacterium]|jgi:hypothetical protein|nr:hypothetical protein [Thermoanaerobaculia bacterium]
MAHRSGWRRLVLVVMLTLVSLPAMAGERPRGRRGAGNEAAAAWRAVVRWVAPSGWLAKLGPEIDPDGVTGVPSGGSGASVRSGSGELGPEIDPNG